MPNYIQTLFIAYLFDHIKSKCELILNFRKNKDTSHGYLVMMYIGSHGPTNVIPRHIDMSSVWPDLPTKGLLYTMGGLPDPNRNETYQYEQEYVKVVITLGSSL